MKIGGDHDRGLGETLRDCTPSVSEPQGFSDDREGFNWAVPLVTWGVGLWRVGVGASGPARFQRTDRTIWIMVFRFWRS